MLDLQHIVRSSLNMLRNVVAVRAAEQERPENKKVERALKQLNAIFRIVCH
jgi:hypothetical protein